jgi:hypothetical protein
MRRAVLITTVLAAGLAIPAAASVPPGGLDVARLAAGASSRAANILAFANRWLGTPYQWGGTTRSGIDCSGYLRQMFRDLFNVELPRTTRQQINLGIDLDINPRRPGEGMSPGDLIFYIGPDGLPTHVVVYAGNDTITHSVSGRGVVVDPIRKVFGRRIVARRLLVPRSGAGGDDSAGFAPIPAAGPIVPKEIPCPPEIQAKRSELARFSKAPIEDWAAFGDRDICDFRALADGLRARGGPAAEANAKKLDDHAVWLESIEALKGEIGRGW